MYSGGDANYKATFILWKSDYKSKNVPDYKAYGWTTNWFYVPGVWVFETVPLVSSTDLHA